MTHAIRIHQPGGPEALSWEEVGLPPPGPGEVRLRHGAVGLNFIDVYHRTGLYPMATPFVPGMEAAGEVVACGPGVSALKPGDRVGYGAGPIGGYAEERNVAADRLVPIPGGIDDTTAASLMLQGMTVQYLLRSTYKVSSGETILFHAAAGGVGLLACQWASALGVTVIGTVGSEEKAALARAHGCHHTINYRTENIAARVRELTGGAGVPVVYDSVGADTFEASLDCLKPRGMLVSFGQSSGPVPPQDLAVFARKGSLYYTRPSIMAYVLTREELLGRAAELFEMVAAGKVRASVNQTYPLAEAAQAHRDLEARRTTGSTVLLP